MKIRKLFQKLAKFDGILFSNGISCVDQKRCDLFYRQ